MFSGADRLVLELAAAHELVVAGQVRALLAESEAEAGERLAALVAAGVLAAEHLGYGEPECFRITAAGLGAIGSRASAPGFDPGWSHAVGVGWVWLAARAGSFGSLERVLSERQMRSQEQVGDADAPFAVRPREFGGGSALHYPDLMLLTRAGRVAVELLVAVPAPREFEAVLRAYAAHARIEAVLCLVIDPRLGGLVQSVAGWLELTPMVHVQRAELAAH